MALAGAFGVSKLALRVSLIPFLNLGCLMKLFRILASVAIFVMLMSALLVPAVPARAEDDEKKTQLVVDNRTGGSL